MSKTKVARAADLFALGCIIAEMYMLRPLFSKRSIAEYVQNYVDDMEVFGEPQCGFRMPCQFSWNSQVTAQLSALPINMKVSLE